MKDKFSDFFSIKKKYLRFIKSQEISGEIFKDKITQLKNFHLPVSKVIYDDYCKTKNTRIIGLSGGQGSGKSTVSKILKIILQEKYNLSVVVFSIDDFYKTLNERKKMSKRVSKLFLTRGVPGTHDTKMLFHCLRRLKNKNFKQILIPKFDKSIDDRFSKKKWTKVLKKPDIVIFEGWCVGAQPQIKNSLIKPLNDLESEKDQDLIWRKRVNYELKNSYKKIFNMINVLIFLKVPSYKYVYKWRALQEKKLKKTSKGRKIMDSPQLKKFIMFYERVTRHMLKTLNFKSKVVISIDTKHRLKSLRLN